MATRNGKTSLSLYIRESDYALLDKIAENDSRNPTSMAKVLLLRLADKEGSTDTEREKSTKRQITIWDDEEVIDRIKSIKSKTGLSISAALRVALADNKEG